MMRNSLKALVAAAALVPALALGDVVNSPHNLSLGSGTTQVCVFCHTPHGANTGTTALWNRSLPTNTFVWTPVNTVNGTVLPGAVSDGSLKCLSCHDGATALGSVLRDPIPAPGSLATNKPASLNGTRYDVVGGATNKDLGGNHPVGVPYPNQTAAGSYNGITVNTAISGFVSAGSLAGVRLYFNAGQNTGPLGVECGSCHDPHGVVSGTTNIGKFLRKDNAASALCTTCHAK
jgi:predicted CXXCH cytochrome family protein